ncbi:unnamed protein product, partial [Polarella glacialis]
KFLVDSLLNKSVFSAETDGFFRRAVTKRTLTRPSAEGRATLDEELRRSVGELFSKTRARDLRQHFDARMETLRREQLEGANEVRKAASKSADSLTTGSRVRVARGVMCRCDAGSTKADFQRGGQTLTLSIAPTASHLLNRLADGLPHVLESLPCEDALERICVVQVFLQKDCLEIVSGEHTNR